MANSHKPFLPRLLRGENPLLAFLRLWKKQAKTLILTCTIIVFLLINLPVQAAEITEVKVSLGTAEGELIFIPNNLEFEAGKKYKLMLDNPSPTKHYFTAKDFADASWTQKVEAGKAEVKGAIHEIELKPIGNAEWVLIPEKQGTFDLYCSIPGHKEAGMIGKIVIK